VLRLAATRNNRAISVRIFSGRIRRKLRWGLGMRTCPPDGPVQKGDNNMSDIRKETDSLGEVDVPADKLWGTQTQRSL
jgi:hypothetical protein